MFLLKNTPHTLGGSSAQPPSLSQDRKPWNAGRDWVRAEQELPCLQGIPLTLCPQWSYVHPHPGGQIHLERGKEAHQMMVGHGSNNTDSGAGHNKCYYSFALWPLDNVSFSPGASVTGVSSLRSLSLVREPLSLLRSAEQFRVEGRFLGSEEAGESAGVLLLVACSVFDSIVLVSNKWLGFSSPT